jgi:hypothetical protein
MPAQSVDPRIDEQREHEAVKSAAHEDAGEEPGGVRPAYRPATGLTARMYPVGNRESVWIGPARRLGLSVRAVGGDSYSADWAMRLGAGGAYATQQDAK